MQLNTRGLLLQCFLLTELFLESKVDLDGGSCVEYVMSALNYIHTYSCLEKYISAKTQQQIFQKPLKTYLI